MNTQEKIQALSNVNDDELCRMWAAHATTKDSLFSLYIDQNSKPLILCDCEAEARKDDVVFIAGLYDWEGSELLDPDRSYEDRLAYAQSWMFNNVDMQADYIERHDSKMTDRALLALCREMFDCERASVFEDAE